MTGFVVSQGRCPLAILPGAWCPPRQQNWLPLPICLLAPISLMWVFVLLKGLLHSLGIRLRDQTWNNYSAWSSCFSGAAISKPAASSCSDLCYRRKSIHSLTGALYRWTEAYETLYLLLAWKKKILQLFSEFWNSGNRAHGSAINICQIQFVSCTSVMVTFTCGPQTPQTVLILSTYWISQDIYFKRAQSPAFGGLQCWCHM